MRMVLPRGLEEPKSSCRSLLPSTAKARGERGSSCGRNCPRLTRMEKASGMSAPIPNTVVRRRFLPAFTSALPCVAATTALVWGTRLKASASSMLNGRTDPKNPMGVPMVVALPGLMPMIVVPNWVNSPSTKRWMPSPMEVSNTTAPIPTAIPSIVRPLRIRCAMMDEIDNWARSLVNICG